MDTTERIAARLRERFGRSAPPDFVPVPLSAPASGNAASGSVASAYAAVSQKVEAAPGGLSSSATAHLFDLAKSLPDGAVILEIGSDGPRSALALAFACAGTRKRIHLLDSGPEAEAVLSALLKRHGLETLVQWNPGDVLETLHAWRGPAEFDLAVFGGAREYVDVIRMMQWIHPRIRIGGCMAFRDVGPERPGIWRAWLQFGTGLLQECAAVDGLRSGRKTAAAAFDRLGRPHADFSFAASWRRHLLESGGAAAAEIALAMSKSLDGRYGSDPEKDAMHAAEIAIGGMPEPAPFRATLRQMLARDAKLDGHLLLWNAMTLMAESQWEAAYRSLLTATRVSRPIPVDRIRAYCAAVKENLGPAGAGLPEPGAVDFGTVSADSTGGGPGAGHYGNDYFNWQKRIGAFGGVANLFKFRDHIRPSDTVVDLGSGGGFLLSNVACARKMGVEINPAARREASLQGGIDAVERPEDLPDDFADVIISNHALEHTHSPLQVLRSLLAKLKPGGQLVLVVPNDPPQEQWDPNDINKHLFTWNPMTLGNLVSLAGFRVVKVEAIQHQWPPNFTDVYRQLGEEGFHAACREQAKRTGIHQIRLVAIR